MLKSNPIPGCPEVIASVPYKVLPTKVSLLSGGPPDAESAANWFKVVKFVPLVFTLKTLELVTPYNVSPTRIGPTAGESTDARVVRMVCAVT
jgi:hypothetical protein